MWLGVAPRTYTNRQVYKEIGLRAQNMITILRSIVNIIGGGGGVACPFNEHKKLHFDNE